MKRDCFHVKFLQLIGKGSFGSVYKAKWRNDVVAVKALSGLPDNGPLVEVSFPLSVTCGEIHK